jgi:hypothetical protein
MKQILKTATNKNFKKSVDWNSPRNENNGLNNLQLESKSAQENGRLEIPAEKNIGRTHKAYPERILNKQFLES